MDLEDIMMGLFGGIGTILLIILLVIAILLIPFVIHYESQVVPNIEANLHQKCINQGYDTFDEWNGVGLFPKKETYVKCKFVNNRQDIQGALNIN